MKNSIKLNKPEMLEARIAPFQAVPPTDNAPHHPPPVSPGFQPPAPGLPPAAAINGIPNPPPKPLAWI